MRVALQISGRLRFTEECLGSLIKGIIEPLKPDVFCSFWEPENPFTSYYYHQALKPKAFEIEKQSVVRPYLEDLFPFNMHGNMPSMSYKFYRVSTIRRTYELTSGAKYDAVIQARSDNIFLEVIDQQINGLMLSPGILCSNSSINPDIDPYISPRMVDNFYLGDKDSIDKAAMTFWHLRDVAADWTNKGMFHHVRIPEIIQSQVWHNLGIRIRRLAGQNPFGDFWYDIDRRETQWR